jgi:CheY-like chemotaxis protein
VIADEFVPHVVLVDLSMPDVDGFIVLDRLRSQPAFARTLVVAVTGYGQQSDKARSIEKGFDAHFVKPVELSLLYAVLMRAEQRRLTGRFTM